MKHHHSLLIEAFDTLFFRDAKPFERGSGAVGSVVFPPAPSVLHGAVRTAYFAQQPTRFRAGQAQHGQIDRMTDSLRISEIALSHTNGVHLFPVPSDLVLRKEDNGNAGAMAHRLQLAARPAVSSLPPGLEMLKYPLKEPTVAATGYRIEDFDLEAYLHDQGDTLLRVQRLSELVTLEPKVGIERDHRSGSVREGHLYFVNFIRPENKKRERLRFRINYCADWDAPLQSEGYLRLGGEGKVAHYTLRAAEPLVKPVEIRSSRLKIYLSTPAYFTKGWFPAGIDAATRRGSFSLPDGQKIEVTLRAAATGRPAYFGGFDQRRQRPKPMRRFAPAGSVYYLECTSTEAAQTLATALHGTSISDPEPGLNAAELEPNYYRHRGFGIAYCGNWTANV